MSPSHNEDDFFAHEDAEKKRHLAIELAKSKGQAEREHLKQLHHMHCANCGMTLQPLSYRGVTVDRCFNCGGVFLNKGVLETLTGEKREPGYWAGVMHFFARSDYKD